MRRSPTRWFTLLLALLLGVGGAVVVVPWRRDVRAAEAVRSADADRRAAGWARLAARPAALAARRAGILAALAEAEDPALLDAADRLRALEAWRWEELPPGLAEAEIAARLRRGTRADRLEAAAAIGAAPRSRESALRPALLRLGADAEFAVRDAALDAAARLAWPDEPAPLAALPFAADDPLRGVRDAALALARSGSLRRAPAPPPRDPAADRRRLEILRDPARPIAARRLAALARADAHPEGSVTSLLEEGPATDDAGDLWATVLLAERDAAASRVVLSWIEGLDDDRRRAALLLAALGGDRAAIARAAERSDAGDAALLALAGAVARQDAAAAAELGHRIGRRRDGRPRPDVLLLRLAAGDRGAVRGLAEGAVAGDAAWRVALVDRFLPSFARRLPPPEADAAAIEAWGVGLDALRRLEGSRLRFDPAARRFVGPVAAAPTGAEDGPP